MQQNYYHWTASAGGYEIPAGVSVALLIYGMHHNPSVFPEPETFKPERFSPENSKGRHPFAFIPFSAGPRNCIGQKYALLEIKIVMANLLRRFQFSVTADDAKLPLVVPSIEVVLKPSNKDGVHLIVSKRCWCNVSSRCDLKLLYEFSSLFFYSIRSSGMMVG